MIIDWSEGYLPMARIFDASGKEYRAVSFLDLQESVLYFTVNDCWGCPIRDFKDDEVYAGEKVPGPIKIEWLV